MNRRTLLKALAYGTFSAAGGHLGWRLADSWRQREEQIRNGASLEPELIDPPADEGSVSVPEPTDGTLQSHERYLEKIRDFDRSFAEDYVIEPERLALLESIAKRLSSAQRVIGHGHFNLLSFDSLLRYSRRYRAIGKFTKQELDFFEEIFATDPAEYGFFGDQVSAEMTAQIQDKDCLKIDRTGHYLFRGDAQKKYERMCTDLDGGIFLTSGIRNVVKQMQLFLAKAVMTEGNLSQASRSLAPPGYSYHAVGDFDIGKVGAGLDNFSEVFAETDEYKKLVDLGYMELRYTPTNPFGVRHEPWHIKLKA